MHSIEINFELTPLFFPGKVTTVRLRALWQFSPVSIVPLVMISWWWVSSHWHGTWRWRNDHDDDDDDDNDGKNNNSNDNQEGIHADDDQRRKGLIIGLPSRQHVSSSPKVSQDCLFSLFVRLCVCVCEVNISLFNYKVTERESEREREEDTSSSEWQLDYPGNGYFGWEKDNTKWSWSLPHTSPLCLSNPALT